MGARTGVLLGFVAIGALATFVALPSEPALAKRMVGTSGADRIVGTKQADRINARGGNDRVKGRAGRDRLKGSRGKDRIKGGRGNDRISGGRGADRLSAVDGQKDRAVNGGPGKDVCRIDRADLSVLKNCEKAKVVTSGGGGGGGAAGKCTAGPPEAKQQVAGKASDLYGVTITLHASADGAQGGQIAIGIEEVCDFPKSLATEAAKLAGGDGVAIIGPGTKVYQGGVLLQGQAATTALANLDEVTLRARLRGRGQWARDEDGVPVPTFAASRITITD